MNTQLVSNLDYLSSALSDEVKYILLYPSSKKPKDSFTKSVHQYLDIREHPVFSVDSSNYGVLCKGSVFVLDVDNHHPDNFNLIIGYLSDLLGVNLNDTMSVDSPSGGKHYYLRFNSNVVSSLLKSDFFVGNLRSIFYNRAIEGVLNVDVPRDFVFDVDIRSKFSNSYIVGAGSYNDNGVYRLNRKEILEISEEAHERVRLVENLRRSSAFKKAVSDNIIRHSDRFSNIVERVKSKENDSIVNVMEPFNRLSSVHKKDNVADNLLDSLRSIIERKKGYKFYYHALRGYVKYKLSCCYSNDALLAICKELNINRDTYTNSTISDAVILRDFENIDDNHEGNHWYHSVLCGKLFVSEKKVSNQEYAISLKNKLKDAKDFYRKPLTYKVLDYVKIVSVVDPKNRKNSSQQALDAMRILDYIVHPLLNVGAEKIVISYDYASDFLNINKLRVKQALRVLRDKGVLSVVHKQNIGLSAVYKVNDEFINDYLSKNLNNIYYSKMNDTHNSGYREPVVYDRFSALFVGAFSGSILDNLRYHVNYLSVLEECCLLNNADSLSFIGLCDNVKKYLEDYYNDYLFYFAMDDNAIPEVEYVYIPEVKPERVSYVKFILDYYSRSLLKNNLVINGFNVHNYTRLIAVPYFHSPPFKEDYYV